MFRANLRLFSFYVFLIFASNTKLFASNYNFHNYSTNQGLSHKTVNAILRDSEGFLWVGTTNGLSRFDGYSFKNFFNDEFDSLSVGANIIYDIVENKDHTIWIATNNGIKLYDKKTEKFHAIKMPEGATYMPFPCLTVDDAGTVWTCQTNLGLFKTTNTSTNTTTQKIDLAKLLKTKKQPTIWRVCAYEGFLWLSSSFGIIQYDFTNNKAIIIQTGKAISFCPSIKIGLQHELLFTIYDQGIYILNTKTLNGSWIEKNKFVPKGIVVVNINDAVRMNDSSIWIATSPGLYRVSKNGLSTIIGEDTGTLNRLKETGVSYLYLDNTKNIWIGTFDYGVFELNSHKEFFRSSKWFSRQDESVKPVYSIYVFPNKMLVYGSSQGLFCVQKNKATRKILQNTIVSIQAINNTQCLIFTPDSIYIFDNKTLTIHKFKKGSFPACVYKDKNAIIWTGYWGAGLKGENFITNQHYTLNVSNDISKNIIYTICGDNDGSLWLGTYGVGLVHVINPTSLKPTLKYYLHNKNNNSISSNEVLSLHNDERGSIWIGTCGGGLNQFNKKTGLFTHFTIKNGLKSNVIEAITSDNDGNIWFTSSVLSKYNVRTESFTHFTNSDGVSGEFNVGSCFKSSDGQIFFGGNNGILSFYPDSIPNPIPPKQPILTGLYIFGLPVSPGDTINNLVPYKASITYSNRLILPYSFNSFSIEFSSLYFFETNKISYSYMLKGQDRKWIPAYSGNRIASYSGLQPGIYTFLVRASNGTSQWSEPKIIIIEIVPPWWMTWWFKVFLSIFILILIIVITAYRINIIKEQNKKLEKQVADRTLDLSHANNILQEQSLALHQQNDNLKENQLVIEMKNGQLQEALESKDKLIGIIGHDFKNPLATLTGFASLLIAESAKPKSEKIKMYSEHIYNSATALMNQMLTVLDWALGQMNDVKCKPVEINLELLLFDAISLVKDSALQKQITISTQLEFTTNAFADPRMISTVFRNLLTNAIKYTARNGSVLVLIQEHEMELDVTFIDTGIGMDSKKYESIFAGYDKNSVILGTENEKGTGLGLQICKSFVEKNNGSISVKSNEGMGSVFTVTLPKGNEIAVKYPIIIENSNNTFFEDTTRIKSDIQTVLIIDDDKEIISMIQELFSSHFKVIEAQDGQAGLQIAQQMLPNFIICDINLPKINGIDLCMLIKNDTLTNHIPVLMITAQKEEDIQKESFMCGADDFITKPFNPYILKHKVIAILENLRKHDERVRKQIDISSNFTLPESVDDVFISKIIQLVQEKFTDPAFDVNMIAKQEGLNRTQLWRKFKNTTGKNLGDYIRDMRMKKAIEMLKTGKYRISEIAFEVGYNEPKYFTKCFIKEFGVSPSTYIENNLL